MTKTSKFAAVALLLMGGVLAVVGVMQGRKTDVAQPAVLATAVPQVDVVVAARDLPAGQLLRAEDVMLQKQAALPAQAVGSSALVVGRSTAVEVAQGNPVLTTSLLEGLAGMLAEGERAVSIKVDEASAVGHKLKPGDWVDVFAVLRRDSQEVDATQARLLLPRKQVLAYGAQLYGEPAPDPGKTQEPQKAVARTAVIAIQVEEVNRLLLAEQHGQVLLALRSPLDHNAPSADKLKQIAGLNVTPVANSQVSQPVAALDASLTALTMAELSAGTSAKPVAKAGGAPRAAGAVRTKAAPGGVQVEVIRGTRKETVRY